MYLRLVCPFSQRRPVHSTVKFLLVNQKIELHKCCVICCAMYICTVQGTVYQWETNSVPNGSSQTRNQHNKQHFFKISNRLPSKLCKMKMSIWMYEVCPKYFVCCVSKMTFFGWFYSTLSDKKLRAGETSRRPIIQQLLHLRQKCC